MFMVLIYFEIEREKMFCDVCSPFYIFCVPPTPINGFYILPLRNVRNYYIFCRLAAYRYERNYGFN